MVTRIQVPATAGTEVRVSVNGDPPRVYQVVGGVIEVPDDAPRVGERTPGQTALLGLPAGSEILEEPPEAQETNTVQQPEPIQQPEPTQQTQAIQQPAPAPAPVPAGQEGA